MQSEKSIKSAFKQLHILFLALLAGQVIFAGVTGWLLQGGSVENQSDLPFDLIVPLLLITMTAIAWAINRRLREKGSELPDPEKKFSQYRVTVIRRLALIEGANLVAVVAALVTGNSFYLLYFLAGMVIFLFFRPAEREFEGV